MNNVNGYFKFAAAALAGMIAAAIVTCVFGTVRVQGDFMEPSLIDGSRVVIGKMAYFYGKPDAGDIVALTSDVYSEDEEGGILLRRVAATEGDKIEIKDGTLYVNGKVHEKYFSDGVYLDEMEETTVGKNRVFVLSDTGHAVLDSRDKAIGQLRTDELLGKVLFK